MIQTVTGKMEKAALGKTLIHEHVSCTSNTFFDAFGNAWLDKDHLAEYAAGVLRALKEKYGLGLFVDGTPIDLGRDVNLLKTTSQKSGVPIVASTGLYWFPSFETDYNKEADIAAWFLSEWENGIGDTDVKPGILKCAAGKLGITEEITKRHGIMSIVQKETGLPIYLHCEHREDIALEQLAILKKYGANIEKAIIGHGAIRPCAAYFQTILDTGCYIAMDQCFCNPSKLADIAQCLVTLCQKGYKKQILLSNDYCIHSDFKPHNDNGLRSDPEEHMQGLGYLFEQVYPAFCRYGGSEEDWKIMTEQNTLDALDI